LAAGLVRRGELVELSSPPAGIFVVVGEDTNNGYPLLAAGLVSPPPAGIFVVVGEDTNNGTPLLPLAWCPHHQRRFSWLLVRTPTTAGGRMGI